MRYLILVWLLLLVQWSIYCFKPNGNFVLKPSLIHQFSCTWLPGVTKKWGGEEHAGNFIDTIVLRLEPWICNPENQLVISLRMIPLNSCTCAYMLVRSLMTAHHTINKKSSFKDTWFSKYGMTSYLKIKIWIISFTLN